MTDKTKPEIEPTMGDAPTELVITDLEVGDGAEAEQFDSSWDRGASIQFPLNGLIKGWQDGIPGMKVGGRRQLICPPVFAYGPVGGGHRLSGRTLVFVIDLLGVK